MENQPLPPRSFKCRQPVKVMRCACRCEVPHTLAETTDLGLLIVFLFFEPLLISLWPSPFKARRQCKDSALGSIQKILNTEPPFWTLITQGKRLQSTTNGTVSPSDGADSAITNNKCVQC